MWKLCFKDPTIKHFLILGNGLLKRAPLVNILGLHPCVQVFQTNKFGNGSIFIFRIKFTVKLYSGVQRTILGYQFQ